MVGVYWQSKGVLTHRCHLSRPVSTNNLFLTNYGFLLILLCGEGQSEKSQPAPSNSHGSSSHATTSSKLYHLYVALGLNLSQPVLMCLYWGLSMQRGPDDFIDKIVKNANGQMLATQQQIQAIWDNMRHYVLTVKGSWEDVVSKFQEWPSTDTSSDGSIYLFKV